MQAGVFHVMPQIVFHLPRSWLGPFGSGVLPFYARLAEGLRQHRIAFDQVPLDRDRVMDIVAGDDAFHIVNHGQFHHPRILNAGIAYIYPYWNLDPLGIRAFSSLAQLGFEPGRVDADVARPFFRRLRQRMVGGRMSRYEQPEASNPDLPAGATSVFLQSEGHRIVGETCHLSRWQMLETVLNEVDGPVIVKPHPRDQSRETQEALKVYARRFANLHVSTGNIHDILAASHRVVTINSAVGVEAYLHRKPVILCGQADFHHIADTAHSPEELVGFLGQEPRRRMYDKYIYWYFGHHCLSTSDVDLTGRFLSRVRAQGFDI